MTSDRFIKSGRAGFAQVFCLLMSFIFLTSCNQSSGGGGGTVSTKAVAAYCPYLPSQSFSSSVNVSGKACYQYRIRGNGSVSEGVEVTVDTTIQGITAFSVTLNGTANTWTSGVTWSAAQVVAGLTSAINANTGAHGVTASGTTTLLLKGDSSSCDNFTYSVSAKLTAVANFPRPIRNAEVRITDSNGKIVQCAETDSTGGFSVPLPANTGNHTVAITSRSYNTAARAYVLNNPTDNTEYALTKTVSTGSAVSGLNFIAPAAGNLEGGAFHILDQINNANDYLRTKTTGCSTSGNPNYFPGCNVVDNTPLLYVYWAKGVNPGSYLGESKVISFYSLGKNELYIVGGVNGDVDCSDTDHFDTSIILHEYGHFIEDNFSKPDNPGGSHNGDSIIDPRLAWGEAWANFFQAAVSTGSGSDAYYRDTWGNIDGPANCRNKVFINYNISTNSPSLDTPAATGEGNFREFSITRGLWQGLQISPFSEIWTTVTADSGMKSTSKHFRNVGLFHQIQDSLTGRTSWATIRTNEKQRADLTDYATPLTAGSCTTSIQAVKGSGDDGSLAKSDLLRNNDFYEYNHTGGSLTVRMNYNKSVATPPDLDLYLYKEKYVYGSTSTMAAVSDSSTDGGQEQISTSLAAGTYLINVQVYTGITAGSATTYSLTINGQAMCPNP